MMGFNSLTLAKNLTEQTNTACEGLESGNAPILEQVTETTGELLKWWFQQDFIDARDFNYHEGQRQAILNTIYAHEVLGVTTLKGLYSTVAADVILENAHALEEVTSSKHNHPKYCMKMATGTGKTWVLETILIWQVLNANRYPENTRFTKNFLIVAPGLIVYDRLLDAFMGKERGGKRNFDESDLNVFQELFIPDTYCNEIFRFVQGAICPKEEIGRKVTSGGFIGISNWHILSEEGEAEEDEDELETPGVDLDPKAVAASVLPLSPGTTQGNDLSQLNRKFERGSILNYLRELPSLMVFNDEAHHIHDFKREGEVTEVEWQKSLTSIAEPKGEYFVQMDFSATPYNQVGSGKKAKRAFFPHIITDFDLRTAMRQGLVKSLVLDKRKELGALSGKELEFKAERDEDGNPTLAEGQRIMLRAGLTKLRKLEKEFATVDPDRHPKMMVMCEDTSVTPLVNDFLKLEGLSDDEILRVDSNRKGELKQSEWSVLREKLFDMDKHQSPRVVVSVLMLREGFDVSNICVIVPLRASQAKILLEQIIGRGLRLMWREEEYDDTKRENRKLIHDGKAPKSLIDVLSIIEHPAFIHFYQELMDEGLAAEVDDDSDSTSSTGDLISVGLREGYEEFDFAIPFILREQEEAIQERIIDVAELTPFSGFTLEQLKAVVGKGEKFHSIDVQSKTRFGDYRVDGGVMTATGYNDYIGRIVRRVTELLSQPLTGSSKVFANKANFPYIQINRAQMAAWIDAYIKQRLFGDDFDPMSDENWRVLLVDAVTEHIIKVWSQKLLESEDNQVEDEAEVTHRHLSEVSKLAMRESSSLLVNKCIYERLPYPSRSGGFEKAFMEMASQGSDVDAFCKINEQKHDFVHLRYVKEDGLPAFYSPDFLVRAADKIYLVETKAQNQLSHPNVKRKRRAAVAWCDRINALELEQRQNCEWAYVLLGESVFYDWRNKEASLTEILDYARIRPVEDTGQAKFGF